MEADDLMENLLESEIVTEWDWQDQPIPWKATVDLTTEDGTAFTVRIERH